MLEKFLNIFRIPDLRKRVLFTAAILAVYRLGAWIPTPGINTTLLERMWDQSSGGSALGLINMFAGGSLRRRWSFDPEVLAAFYDPANAFDMYCVDYLRAMFPAIYITVDAPSATNPALTARFAKPTDAVKIDPGQQLRVLRVRCV